MSTEKNVADMTYQELTGAYNSCSAIDIGRKTEIMRAMRSWLRREEIRMSEDIKREKAESAEQKRLLRETHNNLMSARKDYLDSYRQLNSIIKTGTMVSNVEGFQNALLDFKAKTSFFDNCMVLHIEKCKVAKAKLDQETADTAAPIGS